MQTPKKVLILHVPYEFRGGEDAHVDLLCRAYREAGISTVLYPEDRKPRSHSLSEALNSISPGSKFEELDSVWEKEKPDFIHAHHIYPLFGPKFLRWVINRKIKLVMTVHNHRFFCTNGLALRDGKICKECFYSNISTRPLLHNCNGGFKKSAYYMLALNENRASKLLQNAVSVFIAPSPYINDELIRWGITPSKVRQIVNPIENALPQTLNKTSNSFAYDVFYAGRLSQEKGITKLLECAKLLPEISFGIAGDGPLRSSVERCGVSNVDFLGSLEHEKAMATLENSRMGILPSLCNEILPSFVLECFVLGKRCVVPNTDSTRWLSKHHKDWNITLPGTIANTGDPKDLARAVQEALTLDREQPPEFLLDVRFKIREKLSVKNFSNSLKGLYEL